LKQLARNRASLRFQWADIVNRYADLILDTCPDASEVVSVTAENV
jgi:hypothetical protein